MHKIGVLHFFTRTQLIFEVAALLNLHRNSSFKRVILLPLCSNGIYPNYDGFLEIFHRLNVQTTVVRTADCLKKHVTKNSNVQIFSPSTFPLKPALLCLKYGKIEKIVNTEEGIGSYLSNFNSVKSLFKRGWYTLALRRLIGIHLTFFLLPFGIIEKKRLINDDLAIDLTYRADILAVIHDLVGCLAASTNGTRRLLMLPVDSEEYQRWKTVGYEIFVKPHPRFSSQGIVNFKLTSEELLTTSEELCYKYQIRHLIADHSSSLIYCSVLFNASAICDDTNRWNIYDIHNLRLFRNFCEIRNFTR